MHAFNYHLFQGSVYPLYAMSHYPKKMELKLLFRLIQRAVYTKIYLTRVEHDYSILSLVHICL